MDQSVATMTEKELQRAKEIWRQVHLGTVVSKNTIGCPNASEYDFWGKKGKDSHYKGNHDSTIG